MRTPFAVSIIVLVASNAFALSPAEVFEKVSPSVWAVTTLDAEERPVARGTAVVIDSGRLVTNCHVLVKAKLVRVRQENVTYDAKLEYADVERDLCTLTVAKFSAPAVVVADPATLKVGHRVFAIGNPQGLTLTLSDGLVSAIRGEQIQTSAPISPGSSGGGLFDEQARLVGITTWGLRDEQRLAENLNFALPSSWIREVPERAKQQLARSRPQQNAGSGPASKIAGLPPQGSAWNYKFRDRKFSNRDRSFTVQLASAQGTTVTEVFSVGATQVSYVTDADNVNFSVRRIDGETLFELAPYLLASLPAPAMPLPRSPSGYPGSGRPEDWTVRVIEVKQEDVSVPAGRFQAVRLRLAGDNPNQSLSAYIEPRLTPSNDFRVQRFDYTIWYVPEIGRYVRAHHQLFNPSGFEIGDEWIELTGYRRSGEMSK